MQAVDVKLLLEKNMPDSQVFVDGEGCDFRLTVVSKAFQGVLPVKRQQMVYHHLNSHIASGEIHAVTMKTFTPNEWERNA